MYKLFLRRQQLDVGDGHRAALIGRRTVRSNTNAEATGVAGIEEAYDMRFSLCRNADFIRNGLRDLRIAIVESDFEFSRTAVVAFNRKAKDERIVFI